MPELPEVETAVRGLREPVEGRTISRATFPADPGRMTNMPTELFTARIAGQQVTAITRRAKYLIFHLTADKLLVHLKMTGHLYVAPVGESNTFDRWVRVSFLLDDGNELRFSDSRKFGRVYLCSDPSEVLPSLGPEPLEDDFTLDVFHGRLAGRKGNVKSLLLDQSFVAGVGNIYADESLHIAQIHPLRTADSLSRDEVKRLYNAIRQSLSDGIRYEGASINWYRKPDGSRGESQKHLRVYRELGNLEQPCPVCGGPITKIWVGQRGTHFCANCQPERLSKQAVKKRKPSQKR
jgi:formamidopyrimidine-DNA glycosylase